MTVVVVDASGRSEGVPALIDYVYMAVINFTAFSPTHIPVLMRRREHGCLRAVRTGSPSMAKPVAPGAAVRVVDEPVDGHGPQLGMPRHPFGLVVA